MVLGAFDESNFLVQARVQHWLHQLHALCFFTQISCGVML
jgi:hypothetical protein